MTNAEYLIKQLSLQKHPEGGFFAETYRSGEVIPNSALPERYSGDRTLSTAIYFMVTPDSPSKFHKVNSDEFWFYHSGGSLTIHMINEDGELKEVAFGNNFENGESPQVLIPQNSWFAASINSGEYVLLSCTVAPGFDFSDFTLADKSKLAEEYPDLEEIISKLT